MKELKHLTPLILKYKGRFAIGVVFIIASNIFAIFPAVFFGDAINMIIHELKYSENNLTPLPKLQNTILFYVVGIIGAALIKGVFTFFMRQTIIVMSRLIEYDLKNKLYDHYQSLDLSFYKNNKIGDMMSRLTEDVTHVRMYLGPAIMYSINLSALMVIVLFQMFRTDAVLASYSLLPLPFLSFFIYKVSQKIHKKSQIKQQFISRLTSFVQERISGIRVIKSFGIEKEIASDYEHLAERNKEKNMDLVKIESFFFPTMIMMVGVSFLIILYIGGIRTINGYIQVGEIAEFIIYLNMIIWPVTAIGWVSSVVQRAKASQKRINDFLRIPPEIKNTPLYKDEIQGNIEFKNVSFTYKNTGIRAIDNVSFSLKKGETLAVFGETGCGKTTLVELIARLHDVCQGEILIDGKQIRDHDIGQLRQSLGFAPQEPFLFSQSIASNINFALDDQDYNRIIEVAKWADIHHDIIDFNKQYETKLGERGVTISGGQKQRLSIARALIKDPKIYVFDDSLSAVDTKTEEKIMANLKRISKNKTTIIVTHRVSSAKKADKILVLKEGKVLQTGTHSSLIRESGYYRDIYEKQLLEVTTA